jgi:hypothetical protein
MRFKLPDEMLNKKAAIIMKSTWITLFPFGFQSDWATLRYHGAFQPD